MKLIRNYITKIFNMREIREGLATVNFPENVFYNPVQEFNRDLTIEVINNFNEIAQNDKKLKRNYENGINILEALSATGLRSVRFAKELHNVKTIIANDIDPNAAKLIEENAKNNGVIEKIQVTCSDANFLMYKSQAENKKFHVIDLDPYGSASRFIDAAVQGIESGGLLCVTCTDAAVLCGSATGTSMGKYGSTTIGSKLTSCHEMGIRILLNTIQTSAGRYGFYIEPLLSLSVDFYFRVFVRIWEGPGIVKSISTKMGMVYMCNGCTTYHIQPLGVAEPRPNSNVKVCCATGPPVGQKCVDCGSNFVLGGPMWIDSIHNIEFCNNLIEKLQTNTHRLNTPNTMKRIIGMVSLAAEELSDTPLFYEIDKLCKVLRSITPPSVEFRSALLNSNYRVSTSHCNSNSFKTDAPPQFLWSIIKAYMNKTDAEKMKKLLESDKIPVAGKKILQKSYEYENSIDFTYHKDVNPPSKLQKLLRFQPNPTPNWGPKPKAPRLI